MNKFFIITLLFLLSCGKSQKYPHMDSQQTPMQMSNALTSSSDDYMAELIPLNENVAGPVSGSANFKIDGDQFVAYIRLFNSLNGLVHEQRFYQASSCPTIEQDENNDGFVDIEEANRYLGQPILPLDADLSTVDAGYNNFVFGDATGSYWYEQLVSLTKLMDDLHQLDTNVDDDYVRLPDDESISLDEGVILILGVPSYTLLPETVASSGGYANFQTLPIACGSLRKIYVKPGRIEQDVADPLPRGEVGGPRGEYDNAPILITTEQKTGDYGEEEH